MDLAKDCLDIGVYTDALEPGLAFWQGEVGLPLETELPLGRGVLQHRHGLDGAVLKLNHSRSPLVDEPTGLRGLRIGRPGATLAVLRSPDGLEVTIHPVEGDPVVEVATVVRDLAAARRWWVDGVGAEELEPDRFAVGRTRIHAAVDPARPPTGSLAARGLRYLTIQVRDAVAEHERLIEMGYEEGMAPVRLGDVALVSFVRSPDRDWLEISQRGSLTGPLPAGPT